MCNSYRSHVPLDLFRQAFADLQLPGGAPNLEPRDTIRITETAPLIRLGESGAPELVHMRWGWPGPGGKPVYNFRSDGRRFASGRCLIPADGFYEFTDPDPPAPKRAKKTRWLFTLAGQPWFCIAGVYRPEAADGADAFSMLRRCWRRRRPDAQRAPRRGGVRIATFNINGVRQRLSGLLAWLEETRPDVVGLQEIKVHDADFPRAELGRAGYGASWRGQGAHHGVAILARDVETRRALPGDPADMEARYIEAAVKGVLVGCLYLPNGNPWPGPKRTLHSA